MQVRRYFLRSIMILIAVSVLTSGCAWNFYKQNPRSKEQIAELEEKIDDLEVQRERERLEFEDVKRMLERKLGSQIKNESISLSVDERGLVIVLSDNILFDPGKAKVKEDAYSILDKVASIIKKNVPNKNIGIGGHTDNTPIKHSAWKSNWELSVARATNVLHYLIKQEVEPERLSAIGYGEHKGIASNSTEAGRAKNRRVEIVILPEFTEKRSDNLEDKEHFVK
ncbi:MAG: OmpA family protein [Candidatus Omnitrophica bacterium]|nr:OmpA family protein [Candidatus Omnitrophota bacterium]